MIVFCMKSLYFSFKQALRTMALKPFDFAFDRGWIDQDRYDILYARTFARMYSDIEKIEKAMPKGYKSRFPKSTEAIFELKQQLADATKYLIGD